jgi:ATP/maltotriose-dependent transcriptional regulator MalT
VPRVVAVDEAGKVMLTERAAGTHVLPDAGTEERDAVVADYVDALAELHRIDAAALTLPGYETPAGAAAHAGNELALWRRVHDARSRRRDQLVEFSLALLGRLAPTAVARTVVCHGDAGPGNFVADRGRVTALLDWEFAHLGDPMDDLAWWVFRGHDMAGGLGPLGPQLRRWSDATGLPVEVRSIEFYRALVMDTPRRFQFRHPLVRASLYKSMLPGARISCHRRIAAHLAAQGSEPADLARHIEFSARHGELEAIDVLERAARSVTAQAPVSAARWITTALALLPASEPVARRIRLLGQLAMAKAAVGDLAGGLVALEESLSIVPADHHRARTNVAIGCSEGLRLMGRPEDAEATLEAAYDALDDRESADAVRLTVALSMNAFFLGHYDDVFAWADEAERVAGRLGEQRLLVVADVARASGAAFSGQVALARELHERVRPMIDRLSDDDLTFELGVLANLSTAELYMDLYEDALEHATRGLAIARRSGQTHLLASFIPVAGSSAWMLGRTELAIQIFDDAVESCRVAESDATLAWYLFNRCLPSFMVGDVESALRYSDESWALAASMSDGMIHGFSAAIRAQVLHELGQSAEALQLLLDHAGGPEVTSIAGGWRAIYLEQIVRCHLALGDVEAAAAATSRVRDYGAAVEFDIAVMAADRAEALMALTGGQAEQAVELATSAIERAERMRSPVHVATGYALLGRASAAAGRTADAVKALERAADGYQDVGATRYRDKVDADLRQLGQAVHRRSRPAARRGVGVEALTGRELDVAELIRDRRTNREIAEELFLSLKTVETHVRNIFHKLGVTSRVDIARTLESSASLS